MDRRKGLVPFEGGALARRLLSDFERFFEEAGTPWFRRPAWFGEFPWVPEMEIAEHDGRMNVRVDLPGVKREEITVTVTDDALTIAGERKQEVEEKDKERFHTERAYGRFERRVALPPGVKPEEITAQFENGVLEVTVPLPPAAVTKEPHRVPVAGGPDTPAEKAAA